MKNVYKCIIISSILIFTAATYVFCQESRVVVENWEHRLNRLQPPEKIMDAIGLKPGMVIGDIGAGRGRMAVWFADRVGPQGTVYANDIDKDALDHLRRRCQKQGIKNVVTILGEVEDPLLPKESLDIAFMVSVYHHLNKPVALVRNIIPSLKPDGILTIVERETKKSGASLHSSTPREQFIREMKEAGFDVIRTETFLQEDNIYICRPLIHHTE